MSATRPRWQLALACVAVFLAAADTYVVVLALPAIMGDVGIGPEELQRATPIVSGFLLGYVIVMPLLGRLSDRMGRVPVMVACLGVFAAGSLVTGNGHALNQIVIGRMLQGLGGGGLVPVTLAIVADGWPAGRRGMPLGIVGAVQELGSVIGPLYGAAILTLTNGWRAIFWINLPVAGLIALLLGGWRKAGAALRNPLSLLLSVIAVAAGVLAIVQPTAVASNDYVGVLYTPIADIGWLIPMTLIAVGAAALAIAFDSVRAIDRSLFRLRHLPVVYRQADWLGGILLGGVLGCIVISFAAADPSVQVIAPSAVVLLPVSAILLAAFVVQEQHSSDPLIPLGALRGLAASGSLAANFFIGGALMAALVDVPIFARVTAFPDSQLQAALVLLRLLALVPVGALVGGAICERLGYRATASLGMLVSAAAFAAMWRWDANVLMARPLFGPVRLSDIELAACGLGFGLAIAPINAALLGDIDDALHGLGSALVVVLRMIGMLVGLSLLSALGLRAFHVAAAHIPQAPQICNGAINCDKYDNLISGALVDELHVIFLGAAASAAIAALIAAVSLRRGVRTGNRAVNASSAA